MHACRSTLEDPTASRAAGQISYGQSSLTLRAATAPGGDAYVLAAIGLAVETTVATEVGAGSLAMQPTALEPPAPNPLEKTTRIRFALGRDGDMKLRVVDASGRLVRSIESGRRPAGAGSAEWDARNDQGEAVPAGVYFLTLDAGGTRSVRKVTVAPR